MRRAILFIVVGYVFMANPVVFHVLFPSTSNAPDTVSDITQNNSVIDDRQVLDHDTSKSPAEDNSKVAAELQAIVNTFAQSNSASAGLVVADLRTKARAELNPSEQFVSASLYKLFVAYVTLSDVDTGTLALTDTTKGMGVSVGSCLNIMITVSDNPCGVALGGMYGWSALDTRLASEGYANTILNNFSQKGSSFVYQKTSAEDVALLLTRLYNGELLSEKSSNHFFDLLKAQQINDRLPSGLPEGTVIAHKTGELDGYLHDAGIVFGPNGDYLVVLLTGQWDNPSLDGVPTFYRLSKDLWSFFAPQ